MKISQLQMDKLRITNVPIDKKIISLNYNFPAHVAKLVDVHA